MPLLANDALRVHPYLRRHPRNEEEWRRFIQTLNAQEVVSLGAIILSQYIRLGQTAYDTGTGFWLGDDAGTPKVSIGNSAGNKMTWNGSVLSIIGALTATSGSFTGGVTIGSGGSLSSGQSAYNTGTGYWLEHNAGTPRFSIGNSAGARLTWDGTTLSIFDADGADATIENLIFRGDSDTHPPVGQLIGSETSTSNGGGADEWQLLRTITTNFTGSFRLRVEFREEIGAGADTVDASWRLKNGAGTVVHTETTDSATYIDSFSGEETVTEAGEVWTIEGRSQTDLTTYTVETFVRDIEVRARVDHATIV